jgi:hypothetical protein
LFISAAMQRTQGATVVTFFTVLFLTLGTMFGVLFWNTMSGSRNGSIVSAEAGVGPIKGPAPEAFLWFNPFAAQYDVICGASDGYGGWCSRLNAMTNGAISVSSGGGLIRTPVTDPTVGGGVEGTLPTVTANKPVAAQDQPQGLKLGPRAVAPAVAATEPQPFGVRRDTFWPRSLRAWGLMSVVFILASIQLVSPTRRWRFLRLPSRRMG